MSTNYYHPDTLEHIRNPLPAVADWAGATALPVPEYDPQEHGCRFVDGAWLVEGVPGKTNDEIMTWIGPGAQPTDEQLQQWYANYQEPVAITDPIEKLRAFLDANPDVKAILQ